MDAFRCTRVVSCCRDEYDMPAIGESSYRLYRASLQNHAVFGGFLGEPVVSIPRGKLASASDSTGAR